MSGLIIDTFRFAPPPVAITLDASKMGTGGALSGGNLTLASAGGGGGAVTALSTTGKTTGKFYFEALINTLGTWAAVGISRSGAPADYSTDLGQEAGEYGWTNGGNSYFAGAYAGVSGATFTTGDVIGIAVDFANRRMWVSKNNTFITGNPAAGTGQIVTYASGLGTIFAAVQGSGSTSITARFAAADLTYAPPSGFSAFG